MNLKTEKKAFLLILSFSILILFAQTRSFLLLVDGLTYTALAKNILRTGDWFTLHYSPEQYINFYQHPPLAIWLQALVFKCFGFSEAIARVLPATLGVLTVVAVFLFTRARFGLTQAFYASFVLLSSTRFVKWGSNFYLDGILVFFCFTSFALWLSVLEGNAIKESRKPLVALLSGFLISCAFMTKGVIAFSILGVSVASLIFYLSATNLRYLLLYGIGIATPLCLWIQFAHGWDYLQNYFSGSVASRVNSGLSLEHSIHPWRNIYKLWWPWWPLFVLSVVAAVRQLRAKKPLLFIILVGALSFPIGFSFGSVYLEHYLTPFYPFAAVLVGVQLAAFLPELNEKGLSWGYGLLLVASLFVATIAPTMHEPKFTAPVLWVNEVNKLSLEKRTSIHQLAFTEASGDLWLVLATVMGKTDWQAIGNFSLTRESTPYTVLISRKGEVVSSSWSPVPCLFVEGFQAHASKELDLCR